MAFVSDQQETISDEFVHFESSDDEFRDKFQDVQNILENDRRIVRRLHDRPEAKEQKIARLLDFQTERSKFWVRRTVFLRNRLNNYIDNREQKNQIDSEQSTEELESIAVEESDYYVADRVDSPEIPDNLDMTDGSDGSADESELEGANREDQKEYLRLYTTFTEENIKIIKEQKNELEKYKNGATITVEQMEFFKKAPEFWVQRMKGFMAQHKKFKEERRDLRAAKCTTSNDNQQESSS